MQLPKNAIYVGALVALVAAGGFYGWQYYSESSAPAPVTAPKPKPVPPAAAVKPEALVSQLLEVSGLNALFKGLPDQIVGGMRAAAAQQKTKASVKREDMEKIAKEVFTAQRFQKRASEDLKGKIPEPKLRALVEKSSQPLAKRMTQLELAEPSQAELGAFVSEMAAKPLTGERLALLKRLDGASKSSEMGVEIAFATLTAMMAGAMGEKSGQMEMLQASLAKQRGSIEAGIRNNVGMTLAFLYRKAPDADLATYAEMLETPDLKLFRDVVYESLITEIKTSSKEFGERFGTLLKGTATASAPSSDSIVRTADVSPVKRKPSRSHLDARVCLQYKSNIEIIRCAEDYR